MKNYKIYQSKIVIAALVLSVILTTGCSDGTRQPSAIVVNRVQASSYADGTEKTESETRTSAPVTLPPETSAAAQTGKTAGTDETAVAEETTEKGDTAEIPESDAITVIINKNTGVYHLDENCSYVKHMNDENKIIMRVSDISELTALSYRPCKACADTASGTETKAVETSRAETSADGASHGTITVVINMNSGTFHIDTDCRHALSIKDENKKTVIVSSIEELLRQGYKPCGTCAKAYK